MSLFAFLIKAAFYLDPEHSHVEMVDVITSVVEASPPLFDHDEQRLKTGSLILAVAWREGRLADGVLGDCSLSSPGELCKGKPHSFCTMQIHDTSGGKQELADDPRKCIEMGLAMLRVSLRSCASHPIAWYAAGPRGCLDLRAQRISRDRMGLADRAYRKAKEP